MAHILVIDDEADIRRILTIFFTGEGHLVKTAEDGHEGVKLAALHHFDLIVTDVIMPNKDGLEVLTEIRQKSPGSRIIVMTGGTMKVDKDLILSTAKAMRAHKVVAKPIDLKLLKVAVDEVLATETAAA